MMKICSRAVNTWRLFIPTSINDLKIFLIWRYPIGYWTPLDTEEYKNLQEELLELTTNEETKLKFKTGNNSKPDIQNRNRKSVSVLEQKPVLYHEMSGMVGTHALHR